VSHDGAESLAGLGCHYQHSHQITYARSNPAPHRIDLPSCVVRHRADVADGPTARKKHSRQNKPGACCVRLTPTSLRQFFREPTISAIHALRPCSMRRFWMLARHCGQRWFCRKHCAAQPRHSGWLHGSITGSSRMLRRLKQPAKPGE